MPRKFVGTGRGAGGRPKPINDVADKSAAWIFRNRFEISAFPNSLRRLELRHALSRRMQCFPPPGINRDPSREVIDDSREMLQYVTVD
jgi:hypothetical protein